MTQSALLERLDLNAILVEKAIAARTETVPALSVLSMDSALGTLLQAQNYSLTAGGKRIRPALVMEVCLALGGEREAALPFACAIEMIHTYSLIHDDLPCMDNDDLRRGKPTSHKVYGEATAILAGDALLTDAFAVAMTAPDTLVCRAIRVLSEAAGSCGMVGGQMMDLAGETRRLSLDELHTLHARKTGALIRAAVRLGAIAAGLDERDEQTQHALDTYAEHIGLAFQVVDDILDVTADPSLLGKSCGKDAAENKTTFLSYYTVEEAKAYATALTDTACMAIEALDREGVLCALARYLSCRIY